MATFTKLYLLNAAPTYNPAAFKGAWNDTATAVVRALDSVKADAQGDTVTNQKAEVSATNPFAVCLFQGVSGPLAAQTISGTLTVCIPVAESNVAADMTWGLHVWVTQGNTNAVRGTLLANYAEALGANEFSTTWTAKALAAPQALTSLAVLDGDRLVVEIGYNARNTVTTSYTGYLRYGTCDNTFAFAADLAPGDTVVDTKAPFIQFGTAITEGVIVGRVSQVVREVLVAPSAPAARMTQVVREVLVDTRPAVRQTQVVREVVIGKFKPGLASRSNIILPEIP